MGLVWRPEAVDGAEEPDEKEAREGVLLAQATVPPEFGEMETPVFPMSRRAAG